MTRTAHVARLKSCIRQGLVSPGLDLYFYEDPGSTASQNGGWGSTVDDPDDPDHLDYADDLDILDDLLVDD